MNPKILNNRSNSFLCFICLAVCIVIFLFGLWPLNFHPKNEVEWLKDRNGIRFYGRGIAYTPDKSDISKQNVLQNSSVSIEIWVQLTSAHNRYASYIISLYNEKKSENLMIGQWKSHLIMRNGNINSNNHKDFKEISLQNVIHVDEMLFITITSNKQGTLIYVDGKLTKDSPNYILNILNKSNKTILDQLVLGNSATGKHKWVGSIYGLSIYNRFLTNIEVLQHYQMWKEDNLQPVLEKSPAVLYVFDEHDGNLVHNLTEKQYNLLIPAIFQPIQKKILTMPWEDYRFNLSYFLDVLINVAGFIPFGFFFFAFLTNVKQASRSRNYLFTVLLGGTISLTIELIQVFLPTRNSSLTDLICNILGTVMGVIIFHRVFLFLSRHRPVK